ncbi:hypothetical protein AB0B15_42930 [Streptomyces sp. NPDC045456]|uniref:hypothetical protein n=1 Tax=Streptomyces sp. NPDC045456 TaxID=3155254 RepID=UPI0033EE02BC
MGWVDPEHLPVLERDWRYTRMLNLTRRLLAERERAMPTCSCTGGQTTVRDEAGQEHTVPCEACDGTGVLPTYADNEDNGEADAGGSATSA